MQSCFRWLLWSKGNYADSWSKWFGRYKRQIGIENGACVFHSFRHHFKDALRNAGVSGDINDALTGHAGGGVGRSYGAKETIRRFGLPRLAEAVAKVEYPGLDLGHLMPTKSPEVSEAPKFTTDSQRLTEAAGRPFDKGAQKKEAESASGAVRVSESICD